MKVDEINRLVCKNIKLLLNEISNICDLSLEYANNNPRTCTIIERHVEHLQAKYSELALYQDVDRYSVSSLNIYRLVKNTFNPHALAKKYKKIIFVLDKDETREVIKEEPILDELFTIHNCLPIMRSVFINIVDNAIKYMPEGSALNIEVRKIGKAHQYTFKNLGPKVEDDEIEDILLPGYRGKNAAKLSVSGQGLGLSQIESILQLHKEWLESTFEIRPSVKEPQMFNGVPYSDFIVAFSFEDIVEESELLARDSIINSMPDVVLHNVMQILSKTEDSIKRIKNAMPISDRDIIYSCIHRVRKIKFDLLLLQFVLDVNETALFGNSIMVDINLLLRETFCAIHEEHQKEVFDIQGVYKKQFFAPSSFLAIFAVFVEYLVMMRNDVSDLITVNIDNETLSFSLEPDNHFCIPDMLDLSQIQNCNIRNYSEYGIELCFQLFDNMNFEYQLNKSSLIFYL